MDDASDAQFSSNAASSDRSIGEILVSAGRLSPDDVERIYQEQKKRGLRFGEVAIELGVATEADIQFALSHQFRYPYLQRGESRVSETVVAAYSPFSPQVEALRAVRSQLMRRWFNGDSERQTLAVVSPEQGEGRSWLVANLAVVFSQLGARTLLIDADLRNPAQHRLFGIDNRNGLSSILGGRATSNVVFRIPALHDLSILPSGPIPPNPQELLARSLLGRMLLQLANSFDVILIDTPPASRFADGTVIAALAGGALVVSRQDQTRIRTLHELYAGLRDAGVVITGGVLNGGGKKGSSEPRLPFAPFSGKWWSENPTRLKARAVALLPSGKPSPQPVKRSKPRTMAER